MLRPGHGAWRWVWLALALHAGGLAVDTAFHGSAQRPFGLLEMLWAHVLSYVAAGLAVLGGRRAARAADGRGCRAAAWSIVVLGLVQAAALAHDLVTELDEADSTLGPVLYVLALLVMVVLAIIGTLACRTGRRRRAPARSRGSG